jgi:hypothetical protein
MKTFIALMAVASSLWAFSYEEPEVVVELAKGSGNYEIGLAEEDVAIGPYRLLVLDSTLFLLDQLNQRVLCYDTSGSFVREIKTGFRAFDMAVDRKGRIWLLENRTQPAQVVVLGETSQIDRIKIPYEVGKPVTAITIDRNDELVVLSGRDAYRPLAKEGDAAMRMNWIGQVAGRYHFDIKQFLPSSKALEWLFSAKDTSGSVIEFPLACSMRDNLTFVGDDSQGRIYVGVESVIQDKSGSFYMRSIKVYERAKQVALIPVEDNYYSYDTGWRNVSVDSQGNVYVFTSTPEGKAHIERWHALH